MGWKSTKTITKKQAINLIMTRILEASNDEICDALESLGYGEKPDLKYYGCNFSIGEREDEDLDIDIDGEINF